MAPRAHGDAPFVRRVLIVVAIGALALLLWRLVDLLLLLFGAVLVCILLRAVAEPIARRTPLSDGWALAATTLGLGALIGGVAWLFGAEVRAQVADLTERLPQAWHSFEERFGFFDVGEQVADRAQEMAPAAGTVISRLAGVVTSFVRGLADLLLIVIGGLYLATQPALYRRGVLLLCPPGGPRERFADALDATGAALRRWLLGQLVAMLLVFLLTGVGLWLIGLPGALALALLAGLAEFVPLIGPIVAAIPALLIALAAGWETALWTLLLYAAVQQLESNVITPLVQRQAVELPPAVTVFAVVAFGLLFGWVGVLFATPLAVVVFVVTKKLWVRDTLGEPTELPGES